MAFPLVYRNPDILLLRDSSIFEFDIRNGGFNVTKKYKLLPSESIEVLEGLSREERHIFLGNYAKEEKEFTKHLHRGFQEEINNFVEANEIEPECVLSVKKDSITFFGRRPTKLQFENIEFTQRALSTTFLTLPNKMEFFLNGNVLEDNPLYFTYKGFREINIRETLFEEIKIVLEKHQKSGSREVVFEYLQELREAYLGRQLVHTYYKELSPVHGYKFLNRLTGAFVYFPDVGEDVMDEIDITYNYMNILLPLIQTLLSR